MRKNLEARVLRVAKSLERFGKIKPEWKVHLSRMTPGDGTARWQIEVWDAGQLTACWPRHAHYRTKDFDCYLDGMVDALEAVERGAA